MIDVFDMVKMWKILPSLMWTENRHDRDIREKQFKIY